MQQLYVAGPSINCYLFLFLTTPKSNIHRNLPIPSPRDFSYFLFLAKSVRPLILSITPPLTHQPYYPFPPNNFIVLFIPSKCLLLYSILYIIASQPSKTISFRDFYSKNWTALLIRTILLSEQKWKRNNITLKYYLKML